MKTETDLVTLRGLLEQERVAHFTRNPDLLVALFADDFTNVSAGRVTHPNRAESRARFQAYFERSTFLEWDDIEPPVIRLAGDGSLAYAIVQKRVRVIANDEAGQPQEHVTLFAWVEIWEKEAGDWKLKLVASTHQ